MTDDALSWIIEEVVETLDLTGKSRANWATRVKPTTNQAFEMRRDNPDSCGGHADALNIMARVNWIISSKRRPLTMTYLRAASPIKGIMSLCIWLRKLCLVEHTRLLSKFKHSHRTFKFTSRSATPL